MSAPLFRLVTYGLVRACVTADDKLQALPHLRQCLVFHIRCSLSRCENAEALASFLVPAELSRSSLIFTPRETRAEPSFVRGAFAHGIPAESIFGGVNLIQMRASGRWEVRAEKASCSEVRTGVHVSRGILFPHLPGAPQNCLRRFCGEPHSGFPPPLRHSTCSPSRRRKLRRSSIARLLLFPFRIYIRRGPLGGFSPPKMRDILFVLLIKFKYRIEIIERRTVLTERRSRGEARDFVFENVHVVFKHALNEGTSSMFPAHPPCGGTV